MLPTLQYDPHNQAITGAARAGRCRTWHGTKPVKLRRVSAARETDDNTIAKALPRGYGRPSTQGQWQPVMRDAIDLAPVRSDRRATLLAVATMLMWHADWESLTTRPTWNRLIDHCQTTTGRGSRSSVARALATLIDMHLIARVAHGRRAEFAPGTGQKPNDAAVYVLLIPSGMRIVDRNDTPTELQLGSSLPVRAREATDNHQAEPLRGTPTDVAAQAPPPRQTRTDPHAELWPGSATTGTNGARLMAAAELQRRLPVMRQISTRDVRACLKEFFLAGWTVQDIHHALDWKPDGTRWPHDGANGIGPTSVRGWIAHRLAPWTSDGTPRRSFGQQAQAQRAEELARQQAEREREAARRATYSPTAPPIFSAARQHIRHIRQQVTIDGCPWCAASDSTGITTSHEE